MASRAGFWLATTAVAFAAAFTVWAVTAPAYSSGATIVEANPEPLARIAVALPLALCAAVWLLLHVACRHDLRWARGVALAVGWVLLAFAVVTGFTIGLFVMPVALVLLGAAWLTPVAAR